MADTVTKKGITIRIEPTLHQDIKIHAIKQGKTIQEYVLELIQKDMNKSK